MGVKTEVRCREACTVQMHDFRPAPARILPCLGKERALPQGAVTRSGSSIASRPATEPNNTFARTSYSSAARLHHDVPTRSRPHPHCDKRRIGKDVYSSASTAINSYSSHLDRMRPVLLPPLYCSTRLNYTPTIR